MARRSRFTIYDMMEENGEFEKNPANSQARDPVTGLSTYAGPVPYPKMMYHPDGMERITVPAEIIVTPLGPKQVGEQREIIHKLVNNVIEENEAREAGWHDSPAKAAALARGESPPESKDDRISRLEMEIAKLQMEKNSIAAAMLKPKSSAVSVGTVAKSPPTSMKSSETPIDVD